VVDRDRLDWQARGPATTKDTNNEIPIDTNSLIPTILLIDANRLVGEV